MWTAYDEIFDKYLIKYNEKNKDADLNLPCLYDNAENEIMSIKPTNPNQFIHIIKGCERLVSKLNLWNTLYNFYGETEAVKLIPRGFSLKDETQRKLFLNYYFDQNNKNKIYIIKSIKQRQEGIKLTKDIKVIIDNIYSQ